MREAAGRVEAEGQLCVWAREHWGVVGREQVRQAGLHEKTVLRRVQTGQWKELLPGVWSLGGAPECDWQSVQAALLWAGNRATISHRTAAWIYGWIERAPLRVEISVPHSQILRHASVAVHRSRELLPKDVLPLRGLHITSGARTLIDLASERDLEELLEVATYRDSRVLRWTRARLERDQRGSRGVARLRKFLLERSEQPERPDSVLEAKFLRLLRRAKMPLFHHYNIFDEEGRHVMEADFASPQHRLVVEVDGRRYHSSRASFLRRADKQRRLASMHWRLMVFTHQDLAQPEQVLQQIRAALSG